VYRFHLLLLFELWSSLSIEYQVMHLNFVLSPAAIYLLAACALFYGPTGRIRISTISNHIPIYKPRQ